jgi:glutathione S-transferase
VPVVRTPEGGLLTDSIAIAWHLAEAFPDRGLLPGDPKDRAEAISLIAEMHSGFTALRGACPMNLYTGWAGFRDTAQCARRSRPDRRDLVPRARPFGRAVPLRGLHARGCLLRAGGDPDRDLWPVGVDDGQAYVRHTWNSPSSAAGAPWGWPRGRNCRNTTCRLTRMPFPAIPTLSARAGRRTGRRKTPLPLFRRTGHASVEIGGRIFGFCNAFCRDKTVADPEAWPAFMEIYDS